MKLEKRKEKIDKCMYCGKTTVVNKAYRVRTESVREIYVCNECLKEIKRNEKDF